MSIAYIGYTTVAKEDFRLWVDPPKKNANWKQETFDAKLPELWDKKAEEAHTHLAAGKVGSFICETSDGETITDINVFVEKIFSHGWAHSGTAKDALTKITEPLGLEWSFQNNEIKLVGKDRTDNSALVIINSSMLLINTL